MRILLICRSFPPDINPRSFRVFELAQQFLRLGHELTLVTAQPVDMVRSQLPFANLSVHCVLGFASQTKTTSPKAPRPFISKLRGYSRKIARALIPEGKDAKYALTLSKTLSAIHGQWDLGISVSVPFASHWGFVRSELMKKCRVTVADCGDPLSANPMEWAGPHIAKIEAKILSQFSKVSVPIANAIPVYKKIGLNPNQLVVIPQGFNFSDIKLPTYTKNTIPTFMYAGVFYEKVRNPQGLLNYLEQVSFPFKFVIHTDPNHRETMDILEAFRSRLSNRLEILPLIGRSECLQKMATMDFNLNVSNISVTQSPSKLIDLALVQRPFLSVEHQSLSSQSQSLLSQFLDGQYQGGQNLDLRPYRIENIAMQFVNLAL